MSGKKDGSDSSISALKDKARSGQFGNLKLLGISVGLILVCAISLLFKQGGPAPEEFVEKTPVVATEKAEPVVQEVTVGESFDELAPIRSYPGLMEQNDPENLVPGQRTLEERQRIYREMGSQMPPGVTITG